MKNDVFTYMLHMQTHGKKKTHDNCEQLEEFGGMMLKGWRYWSKTWDTSFVVHEFNNRSLKRCFETKFRVKMKIFKVWRIIETN